MSDLYYRMRKLLGDHCCYQYCFYELGWCLYYLLNNRSYSNRNNLYAHDRIFSTVSNSALLSNLYNREHYYIDHTLAISSNILHANVYNYLWGGEGSNVYTQPRTPVAPEQKVAADQKLKDFISEQKELNSAIRMSLKNALDYGAGYVFANKGEYKSLHPLTIQAVRIKGETAYVYEDLCCNAFDNIRSAVYVFGETGAISEYLELPESNKKYFMARAYRVIDERSPYDADKYAAMHNYSNRKYIHVMSLPFYEDDDGMPVGCGFKAIDSALQLNRLNDFIYQAQSVELAPPSLVSPAILDHGHNAMAAGTFNVFNPSEISGTLPVVFPAPPRGSNGAAYAEFWRNNIRAAYITGGISAVGRGQTTADEASANISSITAMIKNLIRPFDWFVMPLLRDVVYRHRSLLNEDSSVDFNDVDLLLLGGPRTADLIERVNLMLSGLQNVASTTSALDPASRLVFDPIAIIRSTIGYDLPSEFFLDEKQLRQAVDSYMNQLAMQSGQTQEQ